MKCVSGYEKGGKGTKSFVRTNFLRTEDPPVVLP